MVVPWITRNNQAEYHKINQFWKTLAESRSMWSPKPPLSKETEQITHPLHREFKRNTTFEGRLRNSLIRLQFMTTQTSIYCAGSSHSEIENDFQSSATSRKHLTLQSLTLQVIRLLNIATSIHTNEAVYDLSRGCLTCYNLKWRHWKCKQILEILNSETCIRLKHILNFNKNNLMGHLHIQYIIKTWAVLIQTSCF